MSGRGRSVGRLLGRWGRVGVLVVLFALFLGGLVEATGGTWPDCVWGCTAQDVSGERFWLAADASGTPLGSQCTPGESVTAYLFAQLDRTMNATRYGFAFIGDYSLDGVPEGSLETCLGTVSGSQTDWVVNLGTLTWECGAELELTDVTIAWSANKTANCTSCGPYQSSKCWSGEDIIVEAPLIADFAATTVCAGEPTAFTAEVTGGSAPYTYAWDFDGDGTIDSTAANPTRTFSAGTHSVKLTVTDAKGNTDSETKAVTVYPLPSVSAPTLSPLCVDAGPYTLPAGSPSGGTWSGPGVTDGVFNAATAGVGTHTLTYTYTNAYGCTSRDTTTIVVNPLPIVTAPTLSPLCIDAGPYTLPAGSPSGGTWSGPDVTDGVFNAATAGVGTHTLTYTFTDLAGCTASDTTTIVVNPLPTVSAPTLSPLCVDADPYTLPAGSPSGGTWSGPGVTDGVFNAATAGVGTHTLTYTYTDGNGCTSSDTTTITVYPLPIVEAPGLDDVCIDAAAFALPDGTPSGGAWSGPGVSEGYFSPSTAGAGTHTLTYAYTDPETGCANSASTTITVHPLPQVAAPLLSPVCEDAAAFALPDGSPSGGEWGGTGVSDGVFSPAGAGVGTHTLTYTYTDPETGCANSASTTITVHPLPRVEIEPSSTHLTCEEGNQEAVLTAVVSGVEGPLSYLWSTGETTQSITVGSAGTYSVTVTTEAGCSNSASVTITQDVEKPAVAVVAEPAELTCDVIESTLTASVTNAVPGETYSFFWHATEEMTSSIVVSEPGTYLVTVTADASACATTASVVVTQDVTPPTVSIGTPAVLSPSVASVLLDATASGARAPYSYAWSTGATTEDIVVDEPGTYTLTVTDAKGCTGQASVTVQYVEIAIDKVGPAGPAEMNDTLNYAITVTNNSTVALTNVTVVDAMLGIDQNLGTLAVGEAKSVSGSHTVSEADVPAGFTGTSFEITNTAYADSDQIGPVSDDWAVTVNYQFLEPRAALGIEKSGPAVVSLGDTITYTIVVTNIGEVALTDVRVVDEKLDLDTTIPSLAVGASQTLTGTYGPVTEADLPGPVLNTASAWNEVVDPVEDSWSVDIVTEPGLNIVKTGPTQAVKIGQSIQYTVTVTNTGDVTLTNVRVVDAKIGLNETIASLAPGASKAFTGSYGPVTEADLPGPVLNTAVATADGVEQVEDDWSVPIVAQPGLQISKTGPESAVEVGDVITYRIVVWNDGDVTLHNVRVVDAKIGLDETVATLVPGQSAEFVRNYTVTEADLTADLVIVNVATADSDETGPVEDGWSVPILYEYYEPRPEPCIRSDVSVIIYGGWNGLPVRAWAGGAEQETLYTAPNAQGEQQVMWTFYPGEGETWTVSVAAELPGDLDPARWEYKALSSTTVTFGRCEQRVIYLQLIDKGIPSPTAVPQPPVLPQTGSMGGGAPSGRSLWPALTLLGLVACGGWLGRRRLAAR